MEIKVIKTTHPKEKPDQNQLPFGRIFTDHMFTMDYDAGKGWHNAQIEPYGPITLEPSACGLQGFTSTASSISSSS